MNWHYQYIGKERHLTISHEMNILGKRRYGTADMLSIVMYYRDGLDKDLTYHEKLADFGRIVFDFDIDKNTDTYRECIEHYPLNDKYEPIGYIDVLQDLIIQALHNLGRESLVNILKMDKIKWISEVYDYGMQSPWCWTSACREDKISYHLTLPFLTCVEAEGNYPGDICYEGGNTLLIAMKEIYTEMRNIAKYKYLLPDMNLLSKNHEIRLPMMRKMGGGEDTRLRYVGNHGILNALSCIYPSFVPKDLYYLISYDRLYENIPEHIEHYDVDESSYNLLPADIKEMYPTYKMKKAGNGWICELQPLDMSIRCSVCCREHDRSKPFITISGNRYILYCWRWSKANDTSHGMGGPITIGYVNNAILTSDIKNKMMDRLMKKVEYNYRSITSNININTPDIDLSSYTDGDIYVKSAMGTGKTKALIPILGTCSSYLIISNKRIQAHKYKSIFSNATLYKEEGWTSSNVKYLISQFESIYKIQRTKYGILVLDEIESIMRLIISKTTCSKELELASKFISLILNANRILVMDAFLKQDTIEWLQSIRGCSSSYIINNEYMHESKDVYVYPMKDEWYAKLQDDKRRKVIICLSKTIADSVYNYLGNNTLLITSDTQECIKNRDPHEYWHKYENIIYTPALSNSISFELEHFDVVYAYGCTGSAEPEDLVQMMHRVRDIKCNEMHLYCSNMWYKRVSNEDDVLHTEDATLCEEYLPTSMENVYEDMRNNSGLFINDITKSKLAQVWDLMNNHAHILFARVYTNRGIAQRCFKNILLYVLENELKYKIHMNTRYNRREKVKKMDINIDDPEDRKIFHHFVDEKASNVYVVYNTIWRKRSDDIIRLAYMKRRDIEYKHQKEGIEMYTHLKELFRLGGEDIDECIQNKRKNVKLRYKAKDSVPIKKSMILLGDSYNKPTDKQYWRWFHNFIVSHLFLKCTYTPITVKGSNNRYTYELDMTDWLWYDIK